jgi:hypothetical protein
MATFEIHPDGLIYVRGDNATYCDTPENFALDYGAAAPALAEGMIVLRYDDATGLLCSSDGVTQRPAAEAFRVFGDNAIAALPQLLAAQSARRPRE